MTVYKSAQLSAVTASEVVREHIKIVLSYISARANLKVNDEIHADM